MPALCFPNPDALRLALASGIVPPEVAREPVRAGVDAHEQPWVELPVGFPKDAIAALGRIGVTLHGPGTGPKMAVISRWAELLPLRNRPGLEVRGRVLIELPDRDLARFTAELRRRLLPSLGIQLLPNSGRAWVIVNSPSLALDLVPSVEVFTEQAPRVWVLLGWLHPLDAPHLAAPAQKIALLRPGKPWQCVAEQPFRSRSNTYAISSSPLDDPVLQGEARGFPVHLALRSSGQADRGEAVWILRGDPAERLTELARDTNERLLQQFDAAVIRASESTVVLLRSSIPTAIPALGDSAYSQHPALPGLCLPTGFTLLPQLRPAALAELFGVEAGVLTWVEQSGSRRFAVHRLPVAAFRPLSTWVRYQTPDRVQLRPVAPVPDAFAFERLPPQVEARPTSVELSRPQPAGQLSKSPIGSTPPSASGDGLLTRLGKMLRGKSGPIRAKSTRLPGTSPPGPTEPRGRVGDKLASPDILLMGNEWSARRADLELRVLTDLPRLPPQARARDWQDLGEIYAALGNAGDAAVCWLSAVWDSEVMQSAWAANWLRAESRAARVSREGFDPDAVLCVPPSAAMARVAAAYLTWAGSVPQPTAGLPSRLPHLLALIDAHEAELPARALWLARVAAARMTDGDALGLARCRDRIFRRLTDHGPGLDLDAPSFLRFRGVVAGERYQTARDWLGRIRDPLHRWIRQLPSAGRLQWAGIDPDVRCTTAYADLMLAWGLSKLGDRTRALDLETTACDYLVRAGGSGVDPAVHLVLRLAFTDRIRAARDGRADRPGLPLEAAAELPRLDDLGRYAVDKLRSHSGILEPIDLVNPYRGRDLAGFLGSDALGERLTRLLSRPDLAPDAAEVRSLLDMARVDPTASTLPRVIFSLLEVASRLTPSAASEAIGHAGAGIDLIPEWARLSGQPLDAAIAVQRFGTRTLIGAAHAAALFNLIDAFAHLTDGVRSTIENPDTPLVQVVERSAGRYFRTLRRLGLSRPAADLLAAFGEPIAAGPREIGLAIGYYAAGNEDAGNRILNAARDRLFVTGVPEERERTSLAIGYAATLGHAPPRLALGRLEELFLRLDAVTVHGATNRYYTLKPLELIDTVIRGVVSDDFTLGPGVRGWLDDDEFLIRKRITKDLEGALLAST